MNEQSPDEQAKALERVKGAQGELLAWYPFMRRRQRRYAKQRLAQLDRVLREAER